MTFQIIYGIKSVGIGNSNISCNINLNNSSTNLSTICQVNNSVITCLFTNLSYPSSAKVRLILFNVVGPTYSTNYISGFSLKTMGINQSYDLASDCTPKTVTVDSCSAQLKTNLSKVNSISTDSRIITDNIVFDQFYINDTILFYLGGVKLVGVGSNTLKF